MPVFDTIVTRVPAQADGPAVYQCGESDCSVKWQMGFNAQRVQLADASLKAFFFCDHRFADVGQFILVIRLVDGIGQLVDHIQTLTLALDRPMEFLHVGHDPTDQWQHSGRRLDSERLAHLLGQVLVGIFDGVDHGETVRLEAVGTVQRMGRMIGDGDSESTPPEAYFDRTRLAGDRFSRLHFVVAIGTEMSL